MQDFFYQQYQYDSICLSFSFEGLFNFGSSPPFSPNEESGKLSVWELMKRIDTSADSGNLGDVGGGKETKTAGDLYDFLGAS